MEMDKIFSILRPIIEDWNEHNYFKIAIAPAGEVWDYIKVSPVNTGSTAHIPGPVLRDIALLSEVYGFDMGIHANSNVPYLAIQ